MTSKADRLKKVVDEVTCVKCRVNPRFGSLQRCKQCLRADAEVERVARERLLPARAAPRPNRSQAAASSSATRTKARKAKPVATTPAGKALVTARPAQPVLTKQTRQHRPREMGTPFTVKAWTAAASLWLNRFLAAKPATQRATAAAEHAVQNVDHARITYGTVPLAALYPRSNQELAVVQWGLERMGVRIDMVDTMGDVQDVQRLCDFCGARVRVPCDASRANSCSNRSRNW